MNYKEIIYKIVDSVAPSNEDGFFNKDGYSIYKSFQCAREGLVSIKKESLDGYMDVGLHHDGSWILENGDDTNNVDRDDTIPRWASDFIMQAAVDILDYEETTIQDALSGQQTVGSCTSQGFYTQADVDEIVSEKIEDSYMDGYNAGRAEAMEEVIDKLLSKKLVIN